MDQHQRLRLKVITNTGLNIMCTANKDITVDQLYPQITHLYQQVTQDQQGHHVNIQITSLKKNNYYIPKSQIVGEIFCDGDQINCHVENQIGKNYGDKYQIEDKKNIKIYQQIHEKLKNNVKQQTENKPQQSVQKIENNMDINSKTNKQLFKQIIDINTNSNNNKQSNIPNVDNNNEQKNEKKTKTKKKKESNKKVQKVMVEQQKLMSLIKLNKKIHKQFEQQKYQTNGQSHKKCQ